MELLNLIGQPPALSVFPKNSRPQIVEKLIGRESDLEWLKSTDGDLLLIGQPGSGKTFLLQKYAEQTNGLFIIDSNTGRIPDSIRSLNPNSIIVDDAHTGLALLKDLQQLRIQMGAKFKLIASCWPGYKDILIQTLQIPTNLTHNLSLLNRDQIVELIKATGIKEPNDLIRELVNQAEGRPGLAATLCYLCLKGDFRQIVTGEILSREIRTTFEPLVGKESTQILAAFSLGGDAGMPMNAVAAHLGLSLTQLQQVVTGLAAGGILSYIGQNYLSVRPPMLRFALIREIFFCGASSIPYEKLIGESPSMVQTALMLIGAESRNTQIPISFLIQIVEQVDSVKVWNAFSYLGPEECDWIFENHPDKLSDICKAGLLYIPQKIIPSLLSRAVGDKRPLHSNPDHPLRKIEDWVKSAEPGDNQAIKRREILLDSALAWFSKSNNIPVTLKVLCISLSPSFSDNETDPGKGMTVTIWSGLLTENELEAIQNFWPTILDFLKANTADDWSPFFDLLHSWLFPHIGDRKVPENQHNLMRDFAHKMARDVILVSSSHPGIISQISRLFKRLDLPLDIKLDKEFNILFPDEIFREDRQKVQANQATDAERLAKEWDSQDIKHVIQLWINYENEAKLAQITWPRWSPYIAGIIAAETAFPSAWAFGLFDAGASGDMVEPFLNIVAAKDEKEYSNLLKACLKEPHLQAAGVSSGLTAPLLSRELKMLIMSILDDRFQYLIYLLCSKGQIPEDRLIELLSHSCKSIAAAAVKGEWHASKVNIRDSLKDSWRRAVTECLEDKFEGEAIFRKDPSLAFEWLQKRIKNESVFLHFHEDLFDIALQVITLDQRKQLLDQISDNCWQGEIIIGIVRDELEVYSALLQNKRLKEYHLQPLAGNPNDTWTNKALLALDAGYTTSDIAHAVFRSSWSWNGNESAFWSQKASLFEPLLQHPDQRIKDIGQLGIELALALKERALKKEEKRDIFGID